MDSSSTAPSANTNLNHLSGTAHPSGQNPNLVDSILQSIQSTTGTMNVPIPMHIDPASVDHSMNMPPLSMPPLPAQMLPLSEFGRARQAILDEHVPRVERLARNVIAGM